nr:hypothetical protein [Bacteroidota bacterium]
MHICSKNISLVLLLLIFTNKHNLMIAQKIEHEANTISAQQYLLDYEKEITQDPATGTVPRERLQAGLQQILQQQQAKVQGAIPTMVWKERGPKNLPGLYGVCY